MTTEPGFRSRCEQLLATLSLSHPFDVGEFLAAVAERRGRRIERIAAPLPATLPCGMLISTDDVDYIIHAVDTTPLHGQHIEMHEVGHLLLDHSAALDSLDVDAHPPTLDEQSAVRALLPDLSPELIRRIQRRTLYSDAQEREAELFASILLSRAYRSSMASWTTDHGDFAERLTRLRPAAPTHNGA